MQNASVTLKIRIGHVTGDEISSISNQLSKTESEIVAFLLSKGLSDLATSRQSSSVKV